MGWWWQPACHYQGCLVAILTVECAADNREAAVFYSAFDLLSVALMVKFSFTREEKLRIINPSADGSAPLAE
jgi:hypothetical protein